MLRAVLAERFKLSAARIQRAPVCTGHVEGDSSFGHGRHRTCRRQPVRLAGQPSATMNRSRRSNPAPSGMRPGGPDHGSVMASGMPSGGSQTRSGRCPGVSCSNRNRGLVDLSLEGLRPMPGDRPAIPTRRIVQTVHHFSRLSGTARTGWSTTGRSSARDRPRRDQRKTEVRWPRDHDFPFNLDDFVNAAAEQQHGLHPSRAGDRQMSDLRGREQDTYAIPRRRSGPSPARHDAGHRMVRSRRTWTGPEYDQERAHGTTSAAMEVIEHPHRGHSARARLRRRRRVTTPADPVPTAIWIIVASIKARRWRAGAARRSRSRPTHSRVRNLHDHEAPRSSAP